MNKRWSNKGKKILGAIALFGLVLGIEHTNNHTVDAQSLVDAQAFTFDRGIDSINSDSAMEAAVMPERSQLPQDSNNRPMLDRVLGQEIEDTLYLQLRPNNSNRDLLTPELGENNEAARSINRDVRLLQEESQLRELIQMYRSALFQG